MAFVPSSTIWLCAVPFDNSYKNQIYFTSPEKQATYFANHTKKTFSDYLVVRKTTPEGKLINSIKVAANIDTLYGCNYMYYRNANHGTRLFFCFITDLIYINEGTTEIVYETDVYQTWRFDVELLESFVVREHSVTDNVGDNVVAEPFNYGEYEYKQVSPHSDYPYNELTFTGYLVGSSVFVSELDDLNVSRGRVHSGIYQGVYFYYFENTRLLNKFLDLVETEKEDSILFISVIPYFCVEGYLHTIFKADTDKTNIDGYVELSTSVREISLTIDDNIGDVYETPPKNKKLYTGQFARLLVTNHSGEESEYLCEDFNEGISFLMSGDVSASPSVNLTPLNYKGITRNTDMGISITNFPQCSYNSDTYKLWLAKNQFTMAKELALGTASAVMGAGMVMTGGGSVIGAGMVFNGATQIYNVFNSTYQARREPNRSQIGVPRNNLLTAMMKNKFEYYFKFIKPKFAKTIDDYFTMFGYQTNAVKVPNVSSRPYFNYVQTIDVNIADSNFGIPNKDMEILKSMYNNGVTFWKPNATVGDYSVDNSPN